MPASPGDPLRIKATDWNAVLAMLRDWKGVQGTAPSVTSLPCVSGTLSAADSGMRRPVWGEVVQLWTWGFSINDQVAATLPLGVDWSPDADERLLLNFTRPTFRPMQPRAFNAEQTADLHEPFAVCLSPRDMRFAVSGMAMVRVRFHSKWHRFARRPMLRPADDAATDVAKYTGCLDSSHSGPAQIVGVAVPATGVVQTLAQSPWGFLAGAETPPVVWALIRW